MTTEVGHAAVSIFPSAKGFGDKLDRDVGPQMDRSGKRAGSRMGKGILGGLGGVKTGIAAALGVAAVGSFLKGSIEEAREAQKVGALTANVIKTTGGAAKISAGQVGNLATAISRKTGIDDEAIQSASNLLLTFCLEESTEALAKGRGWVKHTDLNAGDLILAYDPDTGEAIWEPVTSMHRFAVDGDLIRWKSKQIDVATTPAHRWWTVGSSGTQPYTPRFRTTEDISGSQVYVQIGGGLPAGFAGEATWSDDLVELAAWVMTEGWFLSYKDQSKGRKPRNCASCDQPARNLAGPARCDAHAKKPIQAGRTTPAPRVTAETSTVSGVGFCQSETANPLEVKNIRRLVERLRAVGHRISETSSVAAYNGSTIIEWHFAGDLGRTIRDLIPGKKLTPGFIESLTAAQADLLFDVLIRADGHEDGHGHVQFIQKDAEQLDVVAMLAAMLGRRSTVLGRGDALYFPETNRLKGSSTNATLEHYEGTVWCPHLRTGIFMARNRGKTFWTGNTNVRNEVGKNNDVFNQATQIATDMGAALGGDPKSSAIQLGKALNDPVKGVAALGRVGVSFTKQQKAQIKTMVESGNTLGAQKIILKELGKEFGGAAAAQATAGDRLKVTFGNLKEAIGTALLPVLDRLANIAVDTVLPALGKVAGFVKGVFAPLFAGLSGKGPISGFTGILNTVGLGLRAMFLAFKDGDVTSDGLVGTFERIGVVVRNVVFGVRAMFDAFREGDVTSDGLVGTFERVGVFARNVLVPAIGRIVTFFRDQLIPATLRVVKVLGGALLAGLDHVRDKIEQNRPHLERLGAALLKVGRFIATDVAPVVTALAAVLIKNLGVAVGVVIDVVAAVTTAFDKHRTALKVVAAVITAVIIPALYRMVAAFVAAKVAAVTSAAQQAASWLVAQAGAYKAAVAAVASAARVVAGWVLMGAQAALQAARVVAGWVLMGVQATLQAARMAAAWIIALGPVAWITAAVIGIGILIYKNWDLIKKKTAQVWDWVWQKIKGVVGFLKNLFLNFTGPGLLIKHFDKIVGFVRAMPGRITSAASGMFDGIKNAFRSAINFVVDAWNGLEFKLPSVDTHIPGVGKVGGFTLGTPNIPRLAAGGILKPRAGGVPFVGAEAGHAEAVVPLTRAGIAAFTAGIRQERGTSELPPIVQNNYGIDHLEANRLLARELMLASAGFAA